MSDTNERLPIDRLVLVTLAYEELDIATMPKPKAWLTWKVRQHEDLLTYGPLWEPSRLFNNGHALGDADLVRFRRAVDRLGRQGLVRVAVFNGRMKHVRLTNKGKAAAMALIGESATEPTPVGTA
jgi:hypothetical protein